MTENLLSRAVQTGPTLRAARSLFSLRLVPLLQLLKDLRIIKRILPASECGQEFNLASAPDR